MSEPETASRCRPVQLTPVWEAVVRDKKVPQNIRPAELLREIRCRVTRGDWPERQHALLVLNDVLAVFQDEPPDAEALQNVLVNNLHAPAARKALQLLLHKVRRPKEALDKILTTSTSEQTAISLITVITDLLLLQDNSQILAAVLEFIAARLENPSLRQPAIKALVEIRNRTGDQFNEALGNLPRYLLPILSSAGFCPRNFFTDSTDSSLSGLEWSDADSSPKVILEKDLQFSDDVVTMRITEEVDSSSSPPQTPGKERRVRFGGEAVKIRTPDSEREALPPQKSKIPLPINRPKVIDPNVTSTLEVNEENEVNGWELKGESIDRLIENIGKPDIKEKIVQSVLSCQGQTDLKNFVKRLLQVPAPLAASSLSILNILPLEKLNLELGDLVWGVCRYLGNSCDIATRIQAAQTLHHILSVYPRKDIYQHLLGPRCLQSKTSRMRENALLAIILSLLAFPNGDSYLNDTRLIEAVIQGVKDTRRRVRLASLETLAVLVQSNPRNFTTIINFLSEKGHENDLLAEAVKTRLARRLLPSVSPEGLVFYALQLNATGCDVQWVLQGAGSSSTGSARSRGQLRAAQFFPSLSPNQERSKWSASAEKRNAAISSFRQPGEEEKNGLVQVLELKSPSSSSVRHSPIGKSSSPSSTKSLTITDSPTNITISPLPKKSFSINPENLTFPPIIVKKESGTACASTSDQKDQQSLPNIQVGNSVTEIITGVQEVKQEKEIEGETLLKSKRAVKTKKVHSSKNEKEDKHANLYPESLRPFERPKEGLDMCLKQLSSMQWEVTMQGLSSVVRLSRHHRDLLHSNLKPIISWMARLARSLRSQVVRATSQATCEVFSRIDARLLADAELDDLMGSLFSRVADTNRFIRADADQALDSIVDRVAMPRAISMVISKGVSHQHAVVRSASARLLLRITEHYGVSKLFLLPREQHNALIKAGANLLTEGSLNTRSYAKSIFRLWLTHSEFLSALTEAVPQSTLRAISKTLNTIRLENTFHDNK